MLTFWAIIVAAGNGSRLSDATGGVKKQYLTYMGERMYFASARIFAQCRQIEGIVFVLPKEDADKEQKWISSRMVDLNLPFKIAHGGARRQDSVLNGIKELPCECNAVLIHDAARPFVSKELIERVIEGLNIGGCAGVVPTLPVSDTIKEVDGEFVKITFDRSRLRAVQTPQGFMLDALKYAHHMTSSNVTDDASMLEVLNMPIRTVEGDATNVKITNPADLKMLACHIHRTGYGYDVHAYASNYNDSDSHPLKLGGVFVSKDFFVRAHSDGDVLLHAVMDAILGCVCSGDIGHFFPDSDPAYKNANSCNLLDKVLTYARSKCFAIEHADITIIAQKPKIAPVVTEIRSNLASLLDIPQSSVSVKATTEEGLGFTGAMLGIKVVAIVEGTLSQTQN